MSETSHREMNSPPHSKKRVASSNDWKGKVKSTIRNRRQLDAHWASKASAEINYRNYLVM